MMKTRRNLPILLFLTGVLLWLLWNAAGVRAAVQKGLLLCFRTIVPSLFPFFVVSSLLTSLGFGELLAGPLSGLMNLYRIDGSGASALVLGLAGGYPAGPRAAAELYRRHLLSRDEANRLLTFCNNANPAFLINVLGIGVFGTFRAGIYLWLIHLLSALLTGLLFSVKRDAVPRRRPQRPAFRAVCFPAAFVEAVRSSLSAILSVCAFVVFFQAAVLPLRRIGGLPGVAVTGGVELFSAMDQLPSTPAGFVLASALAGWGGVCVHAQTLAVLDGSGLDGWKCVAGKAVQALLSAGLALLLAGRALHP